MSQNLIDELQKYKNVLTDPVMKGTSSLNKTSENTNNLTTDFKPFSTKKVLTEAAKKDKTEEKKGVKHAWGKDDKPLCGQKRKTGDTMTKGSTLISCPKCKTMKAAPKKKVVKEFVHHNMIILDIVEHIEDMMAHTNSIEGKLAYQNVLNYLNKTY